MKINHNMHKNVVSRNGYGNYYYPCYDKDSHWGCVKNKIMNRMEEKSMKINKSYLCILLLVMLLTSSMTVAAQSETFGGTMYYRVLDGGENGIYYSFMGGKIMTLAGSVRVIDTTNFNGTPNTTYIGCYEETGSGSGNLICEDSVRAYYDNTDYRFYAVGTTINTSDKYYILCYKIEDDGFDIAISGSIATN